MIKKAILLLLLTLGISTTIFALETNLIAEKITFDNKQNIIREEAATANPGDIIEYTFLISNSSTSTENELSPIIPIPANMVLMPESISPNEFSVSVDGQSYLGYPVKDINGKEVDNSAYKSVKWNIGNLEANEEKSVSLRVKINS